MFLSGGIFYDCKRINALRTVAAVINAFILGYAKCKSTFYLYFSISKNKNQALNKENVLMVNRCERCNRKLSDPNASYGWRCAEILGVGDIISNSPIEVYERFEKGVLNADRLLKGSNVSLSDERKKEFYNANIKMSLWDGIDELVSKNARKDSYAVLLGTNKKYEELTDTLKEFNSYFKEHKAYYDKDDLLFKGTNMVADAIWNSAALALEAAGYKLSGDLLRVAASKNGKTFYAGDGSYAANLVKKDEGIVNAIKDVIRSEAIKGKAKTSKKIDDYIIPLSNGDLGAALHRIEIDFDATRRKNGLWDVDVRVKDTFDFTEFIKFWEKETMVEKVLWAANDYAYFNQKAGYIKPIAVQIQFYDTYKIWRD